MRTLKTLGLCLALCLVASAVSAEENRDGLNPSNSIVSPMAAIAPEFKTVGTVELPKQTNLPVGLATFTMQLFPQFAESPEVLSTPRWRGPITHLTGWAYTPNRTTSRINRELKDGVSTICDG